MAGRKANSKGTVQTQGVLWRYPGPAGWYFVTLDAGLSQWIRALETKRKVGWGYVKAQVTLGKSTWETTLFPSKEHGYLVAIKAVIRKKEKVGEGDTLVLTLNLEPPEPD
jgi:Domain of unknown function (DUF1905)